MPLLLHIITSLIPELTSNFDIAVPAAPAPLTTAVTFSIFLPTTFKPFIIPANTITAVPC